jgi:cysteine desulfurase
MNWFKPRHVYMDYAAATPTRSEVLRAMEPFWTEQFGNASSIHESGLSAKRALSEAREKAARTLRVRAADVIFTSGGTESNNLAIIGSVNAMLESGVSPNDIEVISTALEHPSVSKSLEVIKARGVTVTLAPVSETGQVIVEDFKKLLSPKTRLVSIAYVNSEVGVVENIGKLVRVVRAFEKENGLTVLFHTDACQAPLWLSCALDSLAVDLISLDSGKCRGPKGVGILAKRQRAKLRPVLVGGGQEDGLRPGTEPLPLIVGAAEALLLAQSEHEQLSRVMIAKRNQFISMLEDIPNVVLNGSREDRVANNVNVSLLGVDTEFLVVALAHAGICCSTKSACSGSGGGVSSVVLEMTRDVERASSTVRFTLSPDTSISQLEYTVKVIKEHLDKSKIN